VATTPQAYCTDHRHRSHDPRLPAGAYANAGQLDPLRCGTALVRYSRSPGRRWRVLTCRPRSLPELSRGGLADLWAHHGGSVSSHRKRRSWQRQNRPNWRHFIPALTLRRSPWSNGFPPHPPPGIAPRCSGASQVLPVRPTPHRRACWSYSSSPSPAGPAYYCRTPAGPPGSRAAGVPFGPGTPFPDMPGVSDCAGFMVGSHFSSSMMWPSASRNSGALWAGHPGRD
jgi:hypothetical protein